MVGIADCNNDIGILIDTVYLILIHEPAVPFFKGHDSGFRIESSVGQPLNPFRVQARIIVFQIHRDWHLRICFGRNRNSYDLLAVF